MDSTRVILLGATGETGSAILNGLLDSRKFVNRFIILSSPAHFTNIR